MEKIFRRRPNVAPVATAARKAITQRQVAAEPATAIADAKLPAQSDVLELIRHSPRVAAQREQIRSIAESPRVAQRRRRDSSDPTINVETHRLGRDLTGFASPHKVVQLARGTPHPLLANDKYPTKPAPNFSSIRTGIYSAPGSMDAWLVPGQLNGGGPPVNTKFFLDVNLRNTQVAAASQYHRGHILAQSLGGPGSVENMTPLTETVNYAMRDGPEASVRNYLYRDRRLAPGLIHYHVDVAYGGHTGTHISGPERGLPNAVTVRADVHQGPAQKNQAGQLNLWQQTDPEPLVNTTIPMPLGNFAAPYPGQHLTADAVNAGHIAKNQLLAEFGGLHDVTQAPLHFLADTIADEDQTDPRVTLAALNQHIGTERTRLTPVKQSLAANLRTVWLATSFQRQHDDNAKLNELMGNLSFAGLPEPYQNLNTRQKLSAPSVRHAISELVLRFFDWMVGEIQKIQRQDTPDEGLVALFVQHYGLNPAESRENMFATVCARLRQSCAGLLGALPAVDTPDALAGAINANIFEKAITWDKHLKALWTGQRRWLQ
jgi:hypothetical protein